ncbi:MAG: RNA 2',3'-cyclic phosphodiesterase [Candidatus Micrarchaeota archaeon]|nr:RNA 2',3'-cyclic phosphodiesterase [Candidatus Micrarchaeota archaeon]
MRCFIAADVSEDTRNWIAATAAKAMPPGFRPVAPKNMHITLKFLGEISEKELEVCRLALDGCAVGGPISLRLHGGGAFNSVGRARVVYVSCESPELEKIASCIGKFTQGIGDERKFKGHLTVARASNVPSDASALVRALDSVDRTEAVKSVRIYESILTPNGPEYKVIYEKTL